MPDYIPDSKYLITRTPNASDGSGVGLKGGRDTVVDEVVISSEAPDQNDGDASGYVDALLSSARALAISANGLVQATVPAGTFRMNGAMGFGSVFSARNNVVLKGAGSTLTTFRAVSEGGNIFCGAGTGASYAVRVINSGLVKGATSLTVVDVDGQIFANAQLRIQINNLDDIAEITAGAVLVHSTGGAKRKKWQTVWVTSIVGTTVNFYPPLFESYTATGVTAICYGYPFDLTNIGMEGFTIDLESANYTFGVSISQVARFWAHDLRIYKQKEYGMHIAGCFAPNITRCHFDDSKLAPGSNQSGLLYESTASGLVEDNIFNGMSPAIEVNHGCAGNVFAYNFFKPLVGTGVNAGFLYAGLNGNHGPHQFLNLYEGNVGSVSQWDGLFGSSGRDTLLRNWFSGSSSNGAGGWHTRGGIILNRFQYQFLLLGNVFGRTGSSAVSYILGQPNMGNGDSTGTADIYANNPQPDVYLTGELITRTDNTHGVIALSNASANVGTGQQFIAIESPDGTILTIGDAPSPSPIVRTANNLSFEVLFGGNLPALNSIMQVHTGQYGSQQLDLGVINSTQFVGNYGVFEGGVTVGQAAALGGATVPNSLYLPGGAQPSWWDARCTTFPPVNPSSPVFNETIIPAAMRYYNGPPPAGPDDEDAGKPNAPTNLVYAPA